LGFFGPKNSIFGESNFQGKNRISIDDLFNLDEIKNAVAKEPLWGFYICRNTQIMAAAGTKRKP